METAETTVDTTKDAGAVSMSPPPPCSACGKPATTKAGLCADCDRRAFEGWQRNFIAFMGGLENCYGPEHF